MPSRVYLLLFAIAARTLLSAGPLTLAADDRVDAALATISRVGPGATGSVEARRATDLLAAQEADALPRLLVAMQTSNPVAANWLRTAYEAVVARELARPEPRFPLAELKAFVKDPTHSGRVRRLALALCERLEPGFTDAWVPDQFADPEFRADAVDVLLAAGAKAVDSGDSAAAKGKFTLAFEHARDSQQVVRAADLLKSLGSAVDVPAQLGLVVDWWLLGPFAAPGFSGFEQTFPPEQRVDLAAEYAGADGQPIRWARYHTDDPLGLVNLVQGVAPAAEAVGFAYAELNSPRDMPAQLRTGADDNCTVWLNGQKVFGRQQWLNGIRLDRFVTPVQLRAGKNQLLVKICQGPQHKDPQVPNNWSLQLRFCDVNGAGIALKNLLPPVETEK